MFDFSLSVSTKFSMIVSATALLLFGIGYLIHSTTELIDEIDKNDEVKDNTSNNETL